jgi:hypothetical protein
MAMLNFERLGSDLFNRKCSLFYNIKEYYESKLFKAPRIIIFPLTRVYYDYHKRSQNIGTI